MFLASGIFFSLQVHLRFPMLFSKSGILPGQNALRKIMGTRNLASKGCVGFVSCLECIRSRSFHQQIPAVHDDVGWFWSDPLTRQGKCTEVTPIKRDGGVCKGRELLSGDVMVKSSPLHAPVLTPAQMSLVEKIALQRFGQWQCMDFAQSVLSQGDPHWTSAKFHKRQRLSYRKGRSQEANIRHKKGKTHRFMFSAKPGMDLPDNLETITNLNLLVFILI